MKTSILVPCLLLALFTTVKPAHSQMLPLSVTVQSRVDAVGESAELSLTNSTDSPMICENLDVSLTVIRAESDLPVGSLDSRFAHIFLYPGQTLTQSNLGVSDLQRLRGTDPSVRLFKIIPTLGSCKVAEFVDYCQYAPMSAGERKTVDVLNRSFGVTDCHDWRADLITKIKLPYSHIEDLRPFAYFRNLEVLRVGGNPIRSIDGLQNLKNLEKVCVANTPIASGPSLSAPYSTRCE
jgi:Leucine-rich repeat (LRR) protein